MLTLLRRGSPPRASSPMVTDPFLFGVHRDRLCDSATGFGSTPACVTRPIVEVTSTLAKRFSLVRLRGVWGALWELGDNAGAGTNKSADSRLGFGSSATRICLFDPPLLGLLVLGCEGEVGSTAERAQPSRLSLLGVVRSREQG